MGLGFMPRRFLFLALAMFCLLQPSAAQIKKRNRITIGYMRNYNPWKLWITRGVFEKVTGFTITWVEIVDSFKATVAIGSGEVELVVANSADIARAFSRGMPVRLVYIMEENQNSEALVVHNQYHASHGGPIRGVRDLIGHEIYVWYGSSAHYSLVSFLTEIQVPIIDDTAYMRGADCTLTPCHFQHDIAKSITLIGRNHAEIWELWEQENITACYIGLPDLNKIRKTGKILFTDKIPSSWGAVTFSGLLATTGFLSKSNPKYATYNVDFFMQQFILEFAKANYYFLNNTKEFSVEYVLEVLQAQRVSGGIAQVLSHFDEDAVYQQLILRKYPSLRDQITCHWLGCGDKSRVAWAMKDMSTFLLGIKEDYNIKGGDNEMLTQRDVKPHLRSTSDIRSISITALHANYSEFFDMSYILKVLATGSDGSYNLPTGEYVHLGYELMMRFGPSRSLLIS